MTQKPLLLYVITVLDNLSPAEEEDLLGCTAKRKSLSFDRLFDETGKFFRGRESLNICEEYSKISSSG